MYQCANAPRSQLHDPSFAVFVLPNISLSHSYLSWDFSRCMPLLDVSSSYFLRLCPSWLSSPGDSMLLLPSSLLSSQLWLFKYWPPMLLTFLYVVLPVLWSAAEVLRRWQAASVILHQLIQLDAVVPVRLKEKNNRQWAIFRKKFTFT